MKFMVSTIFFALLAIVAATGSVNAQQSRVEIEAQVTDALEQGQLRDAVRLLERLRYRDELSSDLRLVLAQSYLRQGRLKEARHEADALLEADPNHVEGMVLLGDLAARDQNWLQARELYHQAAQRQPGNPDIQLRLGQSYQELGDQVAAEAAFARYVELTK